MLEGVMKITLVIVLLAAALAYWLLPKTGVGKRLRMNDALFVGSHAVGAICGLAGLLATFVWRELVVEAHLLEFILAPVVLINVYWAMIVKSRKNSELLDEKQIFNITSAAAVTWVTSLVVMFGLFILEYHGLFEMRGILWFPFYFFMTILVYSASTLYFFRKA